MRRLLCTERVVPLDRLEDYLASWAQVRGAARAIGVRAWLFRASGHDDHFLEFLEWDGATPGESAVDRPPLAGARRDLEEAFSARASGEWEEVGLNE